MRRPEADVLDDGPQKPVRIWSRVGRRPILAAGNSNGDIQMLDFTQHADKPTLRLLVLHDDAEREFAYTAGAERRWSGRRAESWTVVSIANDWSIDPRQGGRDGLAELWRYGVTRPDGGWGDGGR